MKLILIFNYFLPPANVDEIKSLSLWLTNQFIARPNSFSRQRAIKLDFKELWMVGDLWVGEEENFMHWNAARVKFDMLEEKEEAYDNLISSIPLEWNAGLRRGGGRQSTCAK